MIDATAPLHISFLRLLSPMVTGSYLFYILFRGIKTLLMKGNNTAAEDKVSSKKGAI